MFKIISEFQSELLLVSSHLLKKIAIRDLPFSVFILKQF